ncbi:MAG: HD domain-containing protein [bacterium]|nr:HD domain-containing protein [bacterium]
MSEKKGVVLFVEDEDPDIDVFQGEFKDDYEIRIARNEQECFSELKNKSDLPDIILLDIYWITTSPSGEETRHPLGIEILKKIKAERCLDIIPVIIYTRQGDATDALKIIKEGGAQDWIRKDGGKYEKAHRIDSWIKTKRLQEELRQKEKELVEERTTRKTFFEIIKAFANAIDSKDHYTHGHSERVAKWAREVARRFGLYSTEIEAIETIGLLHDVGKIGIPDNILLKPGDLTNEEFEVIKKHPMDGVSILRPITYIREWIHLVRNHHEKFDGTGYPDGFKGEKIPLGSRILVVADSYDAMTSSRPYRKMPLSSEKAKKELSDKSGTQFDPKVVEKFL